MSVDRTTAVTLAALYRPEYLADPYPLFRRVREIDPIFWDEGTGERGAWVVTGYEAAMSMVRDPRLSVVRPHWDPAALPPDAEPDRVAILHAMHGQMFAVNPPRHTRIRRNSAHAFVPHAIEPMRPRIEALANRLLDAALARGGPVEVMSTYAFALASALMSELLGIPPEDRARCFRWMLSWGLLVDGGPSAREHTDKYLRRVGEFIGYFRELVAWRREEPGDDLLQGLVDAHARGGFESEQELLGNLVFHLNAGQMTTAHQVGNSLLHLLRDPDAYRRLRAEPELAAAASPEFLRYDCSVQLTRRWVVAPMRVGDRQLDAGDEILVWLGAANRDPARFSDPDRLDLDRRGVRHLAFSHGAHYCLGGGLAEIVNEIALRVFTQRIPDPRLTSDEIERSTTPTFRGPHKLLVDVG